MCATLISEKDIKCSEQERSFFEYLSGFGYNKGSLATHLYLTKNDCDYYNRMQQIKSNNKKNLLNFFYGF